MDEHVTLWLGRILLLTVWQEVSLVVVTIATRWQAWLLLLLWALSHAIAWHGLKCILTVLLTASLSALALSFRCWAMIIRSEKELMQAGLHITL